MAVLVGSLLILALALLVALPAAPIDQIERIIDDAPIGTHAAARLMGTFRKGRPCHPSTITRWCRDGVTRPDGAVIRLAHFYVGSRIMTSRRSLLEFIAAQQPAPLPDAPPRSPAARDRAAEDAARELNDKYGV